MALLVLGVAAGCRVEAHHVDHGLRVGSGDEAELVEAVTADLGVELVRHRVDIEPGPNLEARARAARYEVLPDDVATGHTADDQAETMVLALLRGAGPTGLGAMRPGARRPLLALRRSDTHALCADLGITVADDPTNGDLRHRRNRIRHEVLPLLDDVAGRDVVPVLVRQSELFRQADAHLTDAATRLDPTHCDDLAAADEVVARTAVRRWLRAAIPGEHPRDLATIDRVLAVARLQSRATDVGARWRVVRRRRRLVLEPPAPDPRSPPSDI